jgi:SPFH domain/Band 7 family protein
MTSEQDDSHAIWQGPNHSGQPDDLTSTPGAPGQQQLVASPQAPPPQGEKPSFFSRERLGRFARQFSPVLVPLPFAALIFLFTLPVALRGQSNLPLLPMGVLLVALVVMQGTLLYYAGSNDTLWTLYVIIGYVLFLLVGTLAIFGYIASFVLLIVLLIIGSILARRSVHPVSEGYMDIVTSYGKYARTLNPGLNFVMPWEKVNARLTTQVISWTCPEQVVNISRDQDVRLKATITYQLIPANAHIAALNLNNWEETLHNSFVATLQSVINEMTPADFISWSQSKHARTSADISAVDVSTTRWENVNAALVRSIQAQVRDWGIQVHSVQILDITLIPHLAPSASPVAGMVGRPVEAGVPRGAPAVAAQPLQAQVMARTVEKQPEPASVQQAPTVNTAPRVMNVDMLKDAYEAVRTGRLRDPKTIRDIAFRFEALANDPGVEFDAARAAQNLYQRARIYEESARSSVTSNIAPQPNTREQPRGNENLWTGG